MKKIPLGIQTFKTIRVENYFYIDKTQHALNIADGVVNSVVETNFFFLSRPRRFGKSLFVETLYHLYNGDKELFKGLYIYDKWDWDEKYPVLKIDFSKKNYIDLNNIDKTLFNLIRESAFDLLGDIKENDNYFATPANLMDYIVSEISKKYNKKIVVLIDEYDSPLLDNLDKKNNDLNIVREFISGIYRTLKANSIKIEKMFITGITKIKQANLFSGGNNVTDISNEPLYGDICGYTQKDIETTLMPYLNGVNLELFRKWYNGYWFLGKNKVYNPQDVMSFITENINNPQKNYYSSYWINTAETQLLDKIFRKSYNSYLLNQDNFSLLKLDEIELLKNSIDNFDIENIKFPALLYQTGYLTIKELIPSRKGLKVKLKIPNLEVQLALSDMLVKYLTSKESNLEIQDDILDALEIQDVKLLKDSVSRIFKNIPYTNKSKNNNMQQFEDYYVQIFSAYMMGIGLRLELERTLSDGRIDMVLESESNIYIVEFKTDKNPSNGMTQIIEKEYYKAYFGKNNLKNITLISMEFSTKEKNIKNVEIKPLDELLNELKITNEVVIDNSFDGIDDVGI